MLVIDHGGVGSCASIEAHEGGSKVLIIGKEAQSGGNTSTFSGGFMIPQDGLAAVKYLTTN